MRWGRTFTAVCSLAIAGMLTLVHCGDSDTPVEPLASALCLSDSSCTMKAVCDTSATIVVNNCGSDITLEWTTTEDIDWLTVLATTDTTPAILKFIAVANETDEDRSGIVTVTSDGVAGSPIQVTVEQRCILDFAGSCDTPGEAHDVCLNGSYAYVADGSKGLQVIDISNPSSPALVGSYDTPGTAVDVALCGDYALVADSTSGLQIVNIQDPSNPIFITSIGIYGSAALAIFYANGYAYVAGFESFSIVCLSDPRHPLLEGFYHDYGACVRGVYVDGNYAFVAARWGLGLQIFDVSDPSWPVPVAGSDFTSGGSAVWASNGYAYVSGGNCLDIYNISDPSNPAVVNYWATECSQEDVCVRNGYAYVAGSDSLYIIDVSDPSDPTLLTGHEAQDKITGLFILNGYVYLADGTAGLTILELGL